MFFSLIINNQSENFQENEDSLFNFSSSTKIAGIMEILTKHGAQRNKDYIVQQIPGGLKLIIKNPNSELLMDLVMIEDSTDNITIGAIRSPKE